MLACGEQGVVFFGRAGLVEMLEPPLSRIRRGYRGSEVGHRIGRRRGQRAGRRVRRRVALRPRGIYEILVPIRCRLFDGPGGVGPKP